MNTMQDLSFWTKRGKGSERIIYHPNINRASTKHSDDIPQRERCQAWASVSDYSVFELPRGIFWVV